MKEKGVMIELPKPLAKEAEKLGKQLGYVSLSEVVREAVRDKISALRKSIRTTLIDTDSDAEVWEEADD